MPVSINNTTLTFNDATTQTTSGVTSIGTGTGISSTGGKTPTLTNTGVTSVAAGTGISVSASTGGVTISASGGGVTSLNGLTGAIVNDTFNAIGSYTAATVNANGTQTPGSTIAGSSLRQETSGANQSPFSGWDPNDAGRMNNVGQTGTWRAMARSAGGVDGGFTFRGSNLWVRIS
jgi:hypothetical protein